ncbi:MAG: crossover junction endodeoxyribonuclease RuvC [Myxococcota bacterium]
MIVFGIDPGSLRTGWAALEVNGSRMIPLGYGTLRLPDADLPQRLKTLHRELQERFRRHRPNRVALESLFHHKNARSALVLGHARGVALLAAAETDAQLCELSPAEVKRAVTGNGRAEKLQVQKMVQVLLGLGQVPAQDAADALAVAVAGVVMVPASEPTP